MLPKKLIIIIWRSFQIKVEEQQALERNQIRVLVQNIEQDRDIAVSRYNLGILTNDSKVQIRKDPRYSHPSTGRQNHFHVFIGKHRHQISSPLLVGSCQKPVLVYTFLPSTVLNPRLRRVFMPSFILAGSNGLPSVTIPMVSPLCRIGGLTAIYILPIPRVSHRDASLMYM